MLETLIIVFREGLEAFLIIAIMLAYLTKTGRSGLKPAVYAGLAVAIALSAIAGWKVAELATDPIWEGSLAIAAGVLVATFTVLVMKSANQFRSTINTRLEKTVQKPGVLKWAGLFIFTILMVTREGMETALMLGAISGQSNAALMFAGAFLGILLVLGIGYLWMKQSSKINLGLFMQVTGIFLVLFSIYLFLYGLHELSEVIAIPFIGVDANIYFHTKTEIIETTLVGGMISAALLGLPLFWIALSYWRNNPRL